LISGTVKEGLPRTGVFLDRDGTVLELVEYLHEPEQVALTEGAAEAIRKLNGSDHLVFLVTNQSGVARGMFTPEDVDAVHLRMDELLSGAGAHIDDIYICPHHPTEGDGPFTRECDCRKPAPGLILEAAREYGLTLEHSYLVGDNSSDMAAGKAAGVTTILVRTGYGREVEGRLTGDEAPDHVVDDLSAAVKLILGY